MSLWGGPFLIPLLQWGQSCLYQGMLPQPQATSDWIKGHLIQAGPVKSLPWEFGIEADSQQGEKESAWSLWVSGLAHIKPGSVQRRAEQVTQQR